jgi:hypoxanthine phosphoribosyltransferase
MRQKNKLTVKTLNNHELRASASALNDIIFKDFLPDIFIGIRSGGYVVAEMMAQEAKHTHLLLAISRQRSSTKKKKRIKNILKLLPYFISNRLRIWEHKALNSKPPAEQPQFTPDAGELSALRAYLQVRKACRILIVDDALDSGATMKAVFDLVKAEADSACVIKTAAITVTTESPLIQPDYKLYHYVLCRFPWSFDFKN